MLHAQEGKQHWRVLSVHILVILIVLHYLTCIKTESERILAFRRLPVTEMVESFDKFKFNLKGHKHRFLLFFFFFCLFSVVLKWNVAYEVRKPLLWIYFTCE